MRYQDTFEMALAGLGTHKSRSVLTILGIVIGITAIMLVVALGKSAQDLVLGQIQGLGPNNVFIIPGKQPRGISGFGGTLLNDSLKAKDVEDLRKKGNVPEATMVAPFVFGPAVLSYGSENYAATVLGGASEILKIYNLEVERGDFFSNEDVNEKAAVVVLGQRIIDKLFGQGEAIGQNVKIKGKNFRVIGILAKKGQSPFVDFDEAALMPYTSVQEYILGIRYVQRIVVRAESQEAIPAVVKDVSFVLRSNHNIPNSGDDDFFIQTQADLANTLTNITDALTIFLSSVAAISLVVGGVGIMNIMFVSVTERTQEIGLRKSVGATNKNILFQFLTEAVILTASGGVLGILLGAVVSWLAVLAINQFVGVNFHFTFPIQGALWGILVSVGIGLVFGIFPARRASMKSPVEALRYE